MNRRVFALFFTFALIGVCWTATWAADIMRYEPLTPAGGRPVGDPDFYWNQAQVVEFGPAAIFTGSYSIKTETGFGDYVARRGYFGWNDAGNTIFYDLDGNVVNVDDYDVEPDESNPPYGVLYRAPTTSIQTRIPQPIR